MNGNSPPPYEEVPTTVRLMKMLEVSPNHFLDNSIYSKRKDILFHEYLNKLLDNRNMSMPDLIVSACISKTYAYQFSNGERIPGRDIILRIAFACRLEIDEAQRLLTIAGKGSLYPKIRRDAAILFCLQKKMSLDTANAFLEDLSEVPLL